MAGSRTMDMVNVTTATDVLKYGDVVFLFTEDIDEDGLLRTEGLVESGCSVTALREGRAAPVRFKESLFRVLPQLQYLANTEYVEVFKRTGREWTRTSRTRW